LFQIFQKFIYS